MPLTEEVSHIEAAGKVNDEGVGLYARKHPCWHHFNQ
jgi:hypothetical protein